MSEDRDELIDTRKQQQLCDLRLSCGITAEETAGIPFGTPLVMLEFKVTDSDSYAVMCITPQHARRIAENLVKLSRDAERQSKGKSRH